MSHRFGLLFTMNGMFGLGEIVGKEVLNREQTSLVWFELKVVGFEILIRCQKGTKTTLKLLTRHQYELRAKTRENKIRPENIKNPERQKTTQSSAHVHSQRSYRSCARSCAIWASISVGAAAPTLKSAPGLTTIL